eukprot:3994506-Prymnesium_polylepis.1
MPRARRAPSGRARRATAKAVEQQKFLRGRRDKAQQKLQRENGPNGKFCRQQRSGVVARLLSRSGRCQKERDDCEQRYESGKGHPYIGAARRIEKLPEPILSRYNVPASVLAGDVVFDSLVADYGATEQPRVSIVALPILLLCNLIPPLLSLVQRRRAAPFDAAVVARTSGGYI